MQSYAPKPQAAPRPAPATLARPGGPPAGRSGGAHPGLRLYLAPPGSTVGAPGDRYEREADRVADRVTGPSGGGAEHAGHGLSRAAPGPAGDAAGPPAPPLPHDVLRSPGQPLDSAARAYFEPRFGRDFGRVRIHADAEAAWSARAVGALAYTAGPHVVFGAGRYDPGSAGGRRLLAHELVHTIQQGDGGGAPRLQRQEAPDGEAAPEGLRLVFVETGHHFEANANAIASSIGALKLPYFLPKGSQPTKVGAISCDKLENVLQRAADYAAKLGRTVDQLHVVGHGWHSGPGCLRGSVTKDTAPFFSPFVKMVFHGCMGLTRFPSERFLEAVPGADVYVHSMCSESGGPLDFTRVTQDESGQVEKTHVENVVEEEIGFTEASIQAWVQRNLDLLKGKSGAERQKEVETLVLDWFDWTDFPAFRSAETAAMASAVLADSDAVSAGIVKAAGEFQEKWKAEQERDIYEGL